MKISYIMMGKQLNKSPNDFYYSIGLYLFNAINLYFFSRVDLIYIGLLISKNKLWTNQMA